VFGFTDTLTIPCRFRNDISKAKRSGIGKL
jgi:hypothetical protein